MAGDRLCTEIFLLFLSPSLSSCSHSVSLPLSLFLFPHHSLSGGGMLRSNLLQQVIAWWIFIKTADRAERWKSEKERRIALHHLQLQVFFCHGKSLIFYIQEKQEINKKHFIHGKMHSCFKGIYPLELLLKHFIYFLPEPCACTLFSLITSLKITHQLKQSFATPAMCWITSINSH